MAVISRKKENERTITIPSKKDEPEQPPVERLAVTTKEAAQMLSISERTLWEWTRKGIIPAVKVERRYLYSVEALRRFVNGDMPIADGRSSANSHDD